MEIEKGTYAEAKVLHDKITATGEVSREEIAPFISELPPYVTLESFSEMPSSRGVTMATEGLAAFVKAGIALAVVASIGGLIWYLVSSRKKTETMAEAQGNYQALCTALLEFESFVMAGPLSGVNTALRDEVLKLLNNRFSRELDKLDGNAFLHTVLGDDVFLGRTIDQWLTPEAVSMKPAIERLQKFIADNKGNMSDSADKELDEIIKLTNKLSITEQLERVFAGHVSPLKPIGEESDISRGLRYVGAMEEFFTERERKGVSFSKKLTDLAADFRLVDLVRKGDAEPQKLKSWFAVVTEAYKAANDACERIKVDAKNANFSKAHEDQIEKVISQLSESVKTTERLIDLVILEQRSVQSFLNFCSDLFRMEYATAIEVDKKDNLGVDRDIKRLGENISKAAKKIKR